MNPTYKTYRFDVTSRGQAVTVDFDLDKNVGAVTGLSLESSRRGVLFEFGTQRVELGGVELFHESTRSSVLMFGISAASKYHHFRESVPAGNGRLRLSYNDTAIPPQGGQVDSWQPYTVFVQVEQNLR